MGMTFLPAALLERFAVGAGVIRQRQLQAVVRLKHEVFFDRGGRAGLVAFGRGLLFGFWNGGGVAQERSVENPCPKRPPPRPPTQPIARARRERNRTPAEAHRRNRMMLILAKSRLDDPGSRRTTP